MQEDQPGNPEVHLVTVYQSTDVVEAELIRNLLVDHEVPAEVDGEHQAGFTGVLKVGILVRQEDAQRAAEIIQEHHHR